MLGEEPFGANPEDKHVSVPKTFWLTPKPTLLGNDTTEPFLGQGRSGQALGSDFLLLIFYGTSQPEILQSQHPKPTPPFDSMKYNQTDSAYLSILDISRFKL